VTHAQKPVPDRSRTGRTEHAPCQPMTCPLSPPHEVGDSRQDSAPTAARPSTPPPPSAPDPENLT
jgi:hypothetical protein